jgi:hypothetical protein
MAPPFPFTVTLELAQQALSPSGGPDFSSALEAAERALAGLTSSKAPLELFTNVERTDDVIAAQKIADAL